MRYQKTDISGYLNYGDFTDRDYEREEPTQEDLDELIHADSGGKLFEFSRKWIPFTRIPLKQFPADDKEEIRAIYDTRDLILLVLAIKSLIDNGACNDEALREMGFHINKANELKVEYSVVSLPSGPYLPNWAEEQSGNSRANSDGYMSRVTAPPKTCISEYSGCEIKDRCLYLPGQAKYAESLTDSEMYKVFELAITVPTEYADDPYIASWIMDDIMQLFLRNISTVVEGGIIGHRAGCNMLSFWLLVSERFETSRVQICKACGLPVFASKERGAKRLYCNEACERAFRRAKQFQRLVNEEKVPRDEARRKAHIAVSTAERILARNGLHLLPPSKQ